MSGHILMEFIIFISGMMSFFLISRYKVLAKIASLLTVVEIKQTNYWQSKVALWSELNSKAKIVMLGDSITEGVDWNELTSKSIFLNRGISGDTTSGIIKRIYQVVKAEPEIVFIMVGVNDFGCKLSVDSVFSNYVKILKILSSEKINVVVQSTIYSNSKYKSINEKIKKLNEKLRKYCFEENIVFLDLNITLSANDCLRDDYTYDGIHLYASAYVVWKNLIKDVLLDINYKEYND